MATKNTKIPLISRGPFDPDHVLFIDADGKPMTEGHMFARFGCNIPNLNPETPDEAYPDQVVEREFYEEDFPLGPGGEKVRMFGFKSPGGEAMFPSEPMRLVEGQLVHSIGHMKKNTHTIHHHGIEPSNFNDGVGHTSFEISGSYKYQFRASQAGTFFYHCHKNTVLHFEMGMYGMLIVDPPVVGAPFDFGAAGWVRREDAVVPYDLERIWAVDDIDPRWHRFINHKAGIACNFYNAKEDGTPTGAADPGLNRFDPEIFLISGVPARGAPIDAPEVAARMELGQTLLVRLLNASYSVNEYYFPDLDAEVIDIDGRTLGRSPFSAFSRPFIIPAGEKFRLTTAQRWTMLLRPTATGVYPFRIKFLHWLSGAELAEIGTFVEVV